MLATFAVLAAGWLIFNAVYTIEPTELAFTRTFGRVDQLPNSPIGPGVHLEGASSPLPFLQLDR